MTKDDKILLLHFISRTGMYITIQDESNVVSFMTGYELGTKGHEFSSLYECFIVDRFKIQSSATGWPGQIEILSKELSQNWLQTFKQITLQFITNDNIDEIENELNTTIKIRMQVLIERINEENDLWFNNLWVEEWQSLCALNFEWFKQLWTSKELKAIQSINVALSSKKIFVDKDAKMLIKQLIDFKNQFKS